MIRAPRYAAGLPLAGWCGAVHAYVNDGAVPGVALVVYSPAPGPDDRVLAESRQRVPWRFQSGVTPRRTA